MDVRRSSVSARQVNPPNYDPGRPLGIASVPTVTSSLPESAHWQRCRCPAAALASSDNRRR